MSSARIRDAVSPHLLSSSRSLLATKYVPMGIPVVSEVRHAAFAIVSGASQHKEVIEVCTQLSLQQIICHGAVMGRAHTDQRWLRHRGSSSFTCLHSSHHSIFSQGTGLRLPGQSLHTIITGHFTGKSASAKIVRKVVYRTCPLLSSSRLFPLPWGLRSCCSLLFALSAPSIPLDVFLPSQVKVTTVLLPSSLFSTSATPALPSLPCFHILCSSPSKNPRRAASHITIGRPV